MNDTNISSDMESRVALLSPLWDSESGQGRTGWLGATSRESVCMNLLMPRWAFLQRPGKEGTFLVQSSGKQGETKGVA